MIYGKVKLNLPEIWIKVRCTVPGVAHKMLLILNRSCKASAPSLSRHKGQRWVRTVNRRLIRCRSLKKSLWLTKSSLRLIYNLYGAWVFRSWKLLIVTRYFSEWIYYHEHRVSTNWIHIRYPSQKLTHIDAHIMDIDPDVTWKLWPKNVPLRGTPGNCLVHLLVALL